MNLDPTRDKTYDSSKREAFTSFAQYVALLSQIKYTARAVGVVASAANVIGNGTVIHSEVRDER